MVVLVVLSVHCQDPALCVQKPHGEYRIPTAVPNDVKWWK